MVGVGEGFADFAHSELDGLLCCQGDAESDDGVGDVATLDGAEDLFCGVGGAGGEVDVDGGEGAGVYGLKPEVIFAHAFADGSIGIDVHHAETLGVVFLAEVDALKAAGVDHEGILPHDLVFVDVTEGDIVVGG